MNFHNDMTRPEKMLTKKASHKMLTQGTGNFFRARGGTHGVSVLPVGARRKQNMEIRAFGECPGVIFEGAV